jgi:hypothetical protein
MRVMSGLVVIGALVLSGFVGYHVVYLPKSNEVASIRTQIRAADAAQSDRVKLAGLMTRVARYRQRLPQAADPSWLAREVVELSRRAGIQLTGMTQEPPHPLHGGEGSAPLTRLAVDLKFRTSYHRFGAFLDAIERAEPFLRIDELDVTAPRDVGEEAEIRLVVSTGYIPPAP